MTENYANILELCVADIRKLPKSVLFDRIKKSVGKIYCKELYIKEIQEKETCFILLFGKDNPDATNHKRNRKSNAVSKIDIDETSEVLTNFIHISVSKDCSFSDKQEYGLLFLMEKSSLFRHHSFKNFLDEILDEDMRILVSIAKPMVSNKEYINKIMSSSRLLTVKQITTIEPAPFVNSKSRIKDDFVVTQEISIKHHRGENITKESFDYFFPKLQAKGGRILVTIVDNNGSNITIDFDKQDSPSSLKCKIGHNLKQDTIQNDISEELELYNMNNIGHQLIK